jgi:5-methylcytosine-specific restriction protein A
MAKSWRTAPLPSNWSALRAACFERDFYTCVRVRSDGSRCRNRPLECNHTGSNTDHRLEVLETLCKYHHRLVTSSQGGRANSKRLEARFLPPEPHPSG